MREIEFRGKRKDSGEWVEGDFRHTQDFFGEKIEDTIHILEPGHCIGHLIIPETVGQYTGLKDENGVKIFEGDIVKIISQPKPFYFDEDLKEEGKEYIREVKIEPSSWGQLEVFGSFVMGSLYEPTVKVIGNTYDNSELLKEAKNG